MSRRSLTLGLVGLLGTATVIGSSSLAGAITFGEPDGTRHPNVGSLIGTIPDVGSFQWCTGTMISETVFLTAAHCFVGSEDVQFTVSFAEDIDVDDDGLVDGAVLLSDFSGEPRPHERFASGGANDTYDIAVFLLDESPGVAPATLPRANLLANKALKNATFTTVGYGTERDSKQGGFKSLMPGGERRFAEQTINSVRKAWVTFSMNPSTGDGGTCYGDSGGPHFLGDADGSNKTIVAITVTGDRYCRATDTSYRLDTPNARTFLRDFVDVP